MQRFKQHLQKFIDIDEATFSLILPFFQVKDVRKKEILLEQGHICRHNYFVLEGCLRKYFIKEKGVEQTTEFAIENWWMTDNIAFERQAITDFSIQAIEPSTIMYIDSRDQEDLLYKFPIMERYFRFVYQRAYAASQMRIKYLYGYSREELYHQFIEKHSSFVQRIPQYLVASFLGFTPEYLSELRKKKRS